MEGICEHAVFQYIRVVDRRQLSDAWIEKPLLKDKGYPQLPLVEGNPKIRKPVRLRDHDRLDLVSHLLNSNFADTCHYQLISIFVANDCLLRSL